MKKSFLLVVFILSSVTNVYPDEYNNLISQGIELFKKYEDDKALELFEKAKFINPILPIAYFGSGMVYYAKKNISKAGIEFKKYVFLATSENQKKDFIRNVYQATAKNSNDEEKTLFNEAYNLIEEKKPEEAIEKLKKAIEINPYNARLYYEIGYAYIDVNDLFNAILMLEKGREINPVYEPTLKELLYCYIKLNIDYKIKEIGNDLELIGEDKQYLYRELSSYFYRTKQHELAIYMFEKLIKIVPETYLAYFFIGNSYYNINNKQKAKENLNIFIQNINKIPDSPGLDKNILRKNAEDIIKKCN
ncbi:MAG TPA: tetratricopeptide repeat protein [Spirochaetota bacterium]|nr:tetratricopeptide repeat protein [Spirochaetota bacterium]HOM37952.1 tetratricopeptide repeat protein [Spirochaetota bacterium]HPQ48757.1 tetratricopeptide repeat protein [Spirochaetota bacterium]